MENMSIYDIMNNQNEKTCSDIRMNQIGKPTNGGNKNDNESVEETIDGSEIGRAHV